MEHIYTLSGTRIVSEAWGDNLLIYLYDESGSPIGMQYRNHSAGMTSASLHSSYYIVPLAVSVTDDMETKSASGSVTKIHGNSKQSTQTQHGYIIYDRDSGRATKVGISGQPLNKNGTSPRANRQVNRWNRAAGYERYYAEVVERNMPNRMEALNWEREKAAELRRDGHPMDRHKYP